MYGIGLVKGLFITFKHFITTYIDDIRWLGRRYYNDKALEIRQSPKGQGIFTVQYPEEKLPVPEEFRYIPFLIYEEAEDGSQKDRCTACGICAKVCPPQCIWIVRSNDPNTGRPIPEPTEFFIDIDICMSCGLCAEFCPFDAIKMDHDYELAAYDRLEDHIFNKERLSKSLSYYESIRPTNFAREEEARAEKEAAKAAKRGKAS
ncbi:MAG: 4Fe-4S dicluster domain-containing protein [Anaerolineales bacterium]|nr:4Fe-4S dicluster domain-containing protein [Anaerolineales bacterium]